MRHLRLKSMSLIIIIYSVKLDLLFLFHIMTKYILIIGDRSSHWFLLFFILILHLILNIQSFSNFTYLFILQKILFFKFLLFYIFSILCRETFIIVSRTEYVNRWLFFSRQADQIILYFFTRHLFVFCCCGYVWWLGVFALVSLLSFYLFP